MIRIDALDADLRAPEVVTDLLERSAWAVARANDLRELADDAEEHAAALLSAHNAAVAPTAPTFEWEEAVMVDGRATFSDGMVVEAPSGQVIRRARMADL